MSEGTIQLPAASIEERGPLPAGPLARKVTLRDLHAARRAGAALPMLTCYDHTAARVMQEAGVPLLLVGDSAANVILGHASTTAVEQPFLETLAAAVRRGAPLAYLVVDMAFGTYHGGVGRAVEAVCHTVRRTGCDAVKLEVTPRQAKLVAQLADAGVAVWAHLGLLPQHAQRLGYRFQGRTAAEARRIVAAAVEMEQAGASVILLEAVPPEVATAVVEATEVPVVGCGAGGACCGHVVVLHDLLGLTDHRPRFVPAPEGDLSLPAAVRRWVSQVRTATYPGASHVYAMSDGEAEKLADQPQ